MVLHKQQYQPVTQNKRPNRESKHMCLLIAKTESHQRKKINRGPKGTRKRKREQKISRRHLAWQGRCWEQGTTGCPPLPGQGGDVLGTGYLHALLSAALVAAVVAAAGDFRGQGWLREPLTWVACLPPPQPLLCVAESHPGCGRKHTLGCFLMLNHTSSYFSEFCGGAGVINQQKALAPCVCA